MNPAGLGIPGPQRSTGPNPIHSRPGGPELFRR
jgi:hypothetical protein